MAYESSLPNLVIRSTDWLLDRMITKRCEMITEVCRETRATIESRPFKALRGHERCTAPRFELGLPHTCKAVRNKGHVIGPEADGVSKRKVCVR